MSDCTAPRHGGDLAFASATYGDPKGGWLDLSTGVNPIPYPLPDLPASALTRLPQPADLGRLLGLARSAYRVPRHLAIAAVPGSEAAIRLLPLLAAAGRVAVIAPTYRSHAEAWRAAGRDVAALASLAEDLSSFSVVALANPNNPDARRTPAEQMLAAADALGRRDGLLVADEAFADVDEQTSVLPNVADQPVLVLRSFGKFFGLPGLRLGFVIGQPALVEPLAACFGDWPISGPALLAGSAALADPAWIVSTRQRIRRDAARLQALLERFGLRVAGNAGLFVLVEDNDATSLHQALAGQGIWTRAFTERPDWLRLGLPNEAGFAKLEGELASLHR